MASDEIPTPHVDILEERCSASVATLRTDGQRSGNPFSIARDGEKACFSSREGTKKGRNLRADARIALSLLDRDDPTRYVEIRGIAEIEHINAETVSILVAE